MVKYTLKRHSPDVEELHTLLVLRTGEKLKSYDAKKDIEIGLLVVVITMDNLEMPVQLIEKY
jgi:hypothetical protein